MENQRWEKRLNAIMQNHHKLEEDHKSKKREQLYKVMREVTGKPKINELSDKVAIQLKMKEHGILEPDQQQQQDEIKPQEFKPSLQDKKTNASDTNKSSEKTSVISNNKQKLKSADISNLTSETSSQKRKLKSVDLNNLRLEEFKELRRSFLRAQCLHSRQNSAQLFSPRMHVDLKTGEASDIYISARAPHTAILKTSSGFTNADALQRTLLKEDETPKDIPCKDFYDKNIKWAVEREKGLNTARESRKSCDFSECTFKPSIERLNVKDQPMDYSTEEKTYSGIYTGRKKKPSSTPKNERIRHNTEVQFLATIDTSTIKNPSEALTKRSLTPGNLKVKCKEGFDFTSFMKRAKPMVRYSSLNNLSQKSLRQL
ncbi:unnamed protein product [Blepharisma stoltei]|uniref:Uncharacterized protein n=1 Tax=Blepharisma stoltei TaxID=1481888 RepID=A0AAU9JS65_9CILI|nr:unnamed protein product [Blepharisma stoltei]